MKAIQPGGYERLRNVSPALRDQTMDDAFNPTGPYYPDHQRGRFVLPWVNAALEWSCWDDVTRARIQKHWRQLTVPMADGAA